MGAPLLWVHDDGGRADAGYVGHAGDCATRAITIATGLPYRQVYDDLHQRQRDWMAARRRPPKTRSGRTASTSPRDGVFRPVYDGYLTDLGWVWTPTMGIGTGCSVHLADGELPNDRGTLIVRLSKHVCAVVVADDAARTLVVHDTHDPGRDGTRCVYGYWAAAS